MKSTKQTGEVYSLYVTPAAIELHPNEDEVENARFICAQKDYMSIVSFGRDLAKHKSMSFINYLDPRSSYVFE
ncbi:hypothetical protein C7B76_29630 [filamentous cyanobacterium CCP2]|nr:hypothetical protein C7B76_29630 [filamentous cyanobacterium CCP2]